MKNSTDLSKLPLRRRIVTDWETSLAILVGLLTFGSSFYWGSAEVTEITIVKGGVEVMRPEESTIEFPRQFKESWGRVIDLGRLSSRSTNSLNYFVDGRINLTLDQNKVILG